MSSSSDRTRLLRRLPFSWRRYALEATLRVGDEAEREACAAALVDILVRKSPKQRPPILGRFSWGRAARSHEVLLVLARNWPLVPHVARAATIAAATDHLPDIGAELLRSEDPDHRAAAAAMARDWLTPSALTGAGQLIFDREPTVAEEAERTLRYAALRLGELTPELSAALDHILADAADRYDEHRRRGVLEAAALAALGSTPGIADWLADIDHPAHMVARSALRRSELATRLRCVRWLKWSALAPAAVERLEAPASPHQHTESLEAGYLLLAPARLRPIRRARSPESLLPSANVLRSCPARARRAACRWIDALPLRQVRRVELLAESLVDPDAGVRLRSALRLAGDAENRRDGSAAIALRDFVFDEDEAVALAAARTLFSLPDADGALAGALIRSPHPQVRAEAVDAKRRLDPWWPVDQAEVGVSLAGLRRALGRDREAVVEGLRERVRSADPAIRIAAIRAAMRLRLLPDVELELLAAATSDDPRVAATTMRPLGRLGGQPSLEALRAAMVHKDGRVRASALEAIAHRRDAESDRRTLLPRYFDDAIPRVRANAIRAAAKADVGSATRAAEESLVAMLGDARAEHRISALWITEHWRRPDLAHRVAELARGDPDPRVRERARLSARRLLALMRTGETLPGRIERSGQ